MTKTFKELKLQLEDGIPGPAGPTNSAGSGNIAGIGVGPQGEPGMKKSGIIRRKKQPLVI